ncbi:alkyl sulfatase dimerization domain-containing protein [Streptomyces sp. NPDC091292]|uniref:alkyl sulfatase dimerization domain-containing protein n=1 Tax=Streptomyces sp. NPDC091292 TaxID=3365991 RepID=UPI0037F70F6E
MSQYWHGGPDGIAWFPNGKNLAFTDADERINPALTAHSRKMDQGVFKIGENAFQAYGFALTSPTMVVGPTGAMVIDPPEDAGKARNCLAAFREYTDAEIVAVMYSHWHPDHYAGVRGFVDEADVDSGKVRIIAHRTFMSNVNASSSGGDGPIIGFRVDYSLGTLLDVGPEGRINGGLGPDFEIREMTLIPPTDLVDNELDLELGGLKVHFKWVPSEAADEIVAWFPQLGILHSAETLQGESFPNLHSIRGTKYRDPQVWFRGLDTMRDYPAAYLVPSHGRPVAGAAEVAATITAYRDAIQYVYDQTLRHMNKGLLPHELVEAVQLPEHLAAHPWLGDFYGGVQHSVRQIYVGQLGWFEGDPTFLQPLHRTEASRRLIGLMGGPENVRAAAAAATRAGDHQWSAELLTHLIRVDNNDTAARLAKAENLRHIGYTLTNNNWRNWYMTSAQELDGTLDHSKAIDLQAPDLVKVFPVRDILEGLRVRLDPRKAADTETAMGVTITGEGDYSLTLRRGVLEFLQTTPDSPDIALELTHAALLGLLAPTARSGADSPVPATPLDKLLAGIGDGSVTLTTGTADDVREFFSHFDPPATDPAPITVK